MSRSAWRSSDCNDYLISSLALDAPAADNDFGHLLVGRFAHPDRNAASLGAADVLNRALESQLGHRASIDRQYLVPYLKTCLRPSPGRDEISDHQRIAASGERRSDALQLRPRRLPFGDGIEIDSHRPRPLAVLESHPGDDPTVMSIRAGNHRPQAACEAAQLEVPGGIGDRGAQDGNRGGGAEPSLQLYLRIRQRRSTLRIDHRSHQLATPLQLEVDRLFLQRLGD